MLALIGIIIVLKQNDNDYIVSYSFHFTEANIKIFLSHKYVSAFSNICITINGILQHNTYFRTHQ